MASMLKLSLVLTAVDRATAVVRGVSRVVASLRNPAARVGEAWSNLTGIVRGVAGAMALAGGIAGTAAFGFKRVADEVDELNDQARQLDITTQRLQELGFAAQMNGSSAEALSRALGFLAKNMVEARNGSKEMQQWFARAGITMRDLETLKADAILERIADKYLQVGDAAQNAEKKIAMSDALMGRGAAGLNQMLNQGKATLRQYAAEANRLGIVLDTKTVDAMAEFNDQVDRARLTVFSAMANALRAMGPVLGDLLDRLAKWTSENRELIATKFAEWVEDIRDGLPEFISNLKALGAGIAWVVQGGRKVVSFLGGWQNLMEIVAGVIALKLVVAVTSLTTAVGSLAIAAAASPFGWIAAAVGFAYALAFHLDKVVAVMERINQATPEWFKKWTLPGWFMTGLESVGKEKLAERASERAGAERIKAPNFAGTLKIEIDSKGQAVLRSLIKDPGSDVDLDVYLGRQMAVGR